MTQETSMHDSAPTMHGREQGMHDRSPEPPCPFPACDCRRRQEQAAATTRAIDGGKR